MLVIGAPDGRLREASFVIPARRLRLLAYILKKSSDIAFHALAIRPKNTQDFDSFLWSVFRAVD